MNFFWTNRSWVQLGWKFVLNFGGLHQLSKWYSQWDDNAKGAYGTVHSLKAHKYNMHKRSKCEICGQSLCNTFWLKRHMSASHGIMPEGSIPCSHCPLFFSSKGAKDNHVKKQHADLFKVWTIVIFENKLKPGQRGHEFEPSLRGGLFQISKGRASLTYSVNCICMGQHYTVGVTRWIT